MYYPHLERQDQNVRVLVKVREIDDKMTEILNELKIINDKIDSLIKSKP